MARFNALWKSVGGPGTPPAVDRRAVRARVNAVLDADRKERRIYMRQKIRAAIAVAAIAAAITGSALAVTNNWDMVQLFFKGDTASAQEYVDSTARSASDENYTLTVESAMADETTVFLIVTFTANNEESREFLFSDDFYGIDTFSIHSAEQIRADSSTPEESIPYVSSVELGEIEIPDENSRSFHLRVTADQPVSALLVGSGYMDRENAVEVPVTPAPSITLELGISGVGIPDLDTPVPGTLTVERVTLSPFTCHIECADLPLTNGYFTEPRIFFRMADGSVRTQSQMLKSYGGSIGSYDEFYTDDAGIWYGRYYFDYKFIGVQDLENIVSIIAFDVEYPLDGSASIQLEHDPSLDPFTLPAFKTLTETSGFLIPVRALTEQLGGVCRWDPETGDVTCVCRGVTVVLHPGDDTAEVNGQPVPMREPAAVQKGSLTANAQLFTDAWGLYAFVSRSRTYIGDDIEITWSDWYIVP